MGAKKAALPAGEFLQSWSQEVFGSLKTSLGEILETARVARNDISQARANGEASWAYHITQCGWLLAHSDHSARNSALSSISSLISQHLRYCALITQTNLFAGKRQAILTRGRLAIADDELQPAAAAFFDDESPLIDDNPSSNSPSPVLDDDDDSPGK